MTTIVDSAIFEELATSGLAAEVEAWLADPSRTAHRLVTLPTAQLVEEALAELLTVAPGGPALPSGLWRVMPDRLLALHPGRRRERMDRLRISETEHLLLTATVLTEWGWAQSGSRLRTVGGHRCIRGAQRALFQLGYGTEITADMAGRRIQGVLTSSGIREPYQRWNERPHVSAGAAIRVVLAAAGGGQ